MNQQLDKVLYSVKQKKRGRPESNIPVEDTNDNADKAIGKRLLKPEEIFALVKNSGKFNIVVEGTTDHEIYDNLTTSLGINDLDYYEAGCREEVFKVYRLIKDARKEGKISKVDVAFIADQDSWVFLDKKPPEGYEDICIDEIIWTEGYSIENDLYIEAQLKQFVTKDLEDCYDDTLDAICTWYAFEVVNWDRKQALPVAKHLEEIIPQGYSDLKCELLEELKRKGFDPTCKELEQKKWEIKNDYAKLIRGKTLFQLIQRFLKKRALPANYSKGWNDMLAVIAITYSKSLVENLGEKLKDKLPGLKNLQSSSVNELVKRKWAAGREIAVTEVEKHLPDASASGPQT